MRDPGCVRDVVHRGAGDDGPVTLRLDDGTELVGDELLVATGRIFNSDDIGLETVGLEAGGPVEVDDLLRVTAVSEVWLRLLETDRGV